MTKKESHPPPHLRKNGRYVILAAMKIFRRFTICLLAGLATALPAQEAERLTAAELLANCREGMPLNDVTLSGRLIVRKPRGFIKSENKFALSIDTGSDPALATCVLYDAKGESIVERVVMTRPRDGEAIIKRFSGNPLQEQEPPSLGSRVMGTDLLWLDLTLDFLWWPNAAYDTNPRTDRRVLGRACEVVIAPPPKPIPGCSGVRMWIDKQTGFLMKAEKLGMKGETLRYFWVQKVKEFEKDTWMIRLIKAEAEGSQYQTQLLVDALDGEVFEDAADAE